MKETQAQLYLEMKQHKRVVRLLAPKRGGAGASDVTAAAASAASALPVVRRLRRLTILFMGLGGMERWVDALSAVQAALGEVATLWAVLQHSGALLHVLVQCASSS